MGALQKRICDRFSPSHRFRTNLNVLLSLHNKMLSLQEGATKTASRLSLCTFERGMWNYFYANYVMALEHTFLYFFRLFSSLLSSFFYLTTANCFPSDAQRAENRACICWTGTFLLRRTLQPRRKIYLHFLWRILQAPVIFLLHAIAMQRPRRQRRMQCKFFKFI